MNTLGTLVPFTTLIGMVLIAVNVAFVEIANLHRDESLQITTPQIATACFS